MWVRSELKSKARATFKMNYWPCVLISFILLICTGGTGGGYHASSNSSSSSSNEFSSSINDAQTAAIIAIIIGAVLVALVVGLVLKIFVFNIFAVGGHRFYVENQVKKAPIKCIVFAFQKGRYINTLVTMLLKHIYIALWSLLLIIPGIVKSYSYYMVDYIIAENPEISRDRAFEISKQTMNGQKWNTFVLDLSFIGWYILSCFTCGLLSIFYVNPYNDSTKAQLYFVLRSIAINNGIATSEELCGIND